MRSRRGDQRHGWSKPIGDSISVDGGLSANRYFTQFLANLIQKRIVTPRQQRSPLRRGAVGA
ncbi:FGGY-family carbohydrate kinase [Serratia ureilytica]